MKKRENLKIYEKVPSMSQYLNSAHHKMSSSKSHLPKMSQQKINIVLHSNLQIRSKQRQSTNFQTLKSPILTFQRQSIQLYQQKERSFNDANLLPEIKMRALSLEKIDRHSATNNLKVPDINNIKVRVSSEQAEAVVSRWRKSMSGMELLKKKKNSDMSSSNFLYLKLQENQKKKILIIPRKVSTQVIKDPRKGSPRPLSLPKHHSIKTTWQLYNSIRYYNREEWFWLFHLEQQLSLKEVIEEFQKIELNRNLQPSKKLTMRQAYQLKKEIVSEIKGEKSLSIQANIEKLAEMALDDKEKDKFLMIGFFISLRQKLKRQTTSSDKQTLDKDQKSNEKLIYKKRGIQEIKFVYKEEAILSIKEEISNWKSYKFQDPNIINIKILSVLALHVIKLQSPLFGFEDLELISTTIRLKKKGQTIVDYLSGEERLVHFESLLYLIFQFYRNLYYLKLDEEMKVEQYNSLKAYMELYESRDVVNFQRFEDRYRISATIQNIKPAAVGIYPYQDSRIRNQIMVRNLQRQLHNESEEDGEGALGRKPKIKINQKALQTHINQEIQQQYLQGSSSQSSKDLMSRSDISSQQDSSRLESKLEVNELPSRLSMRPGSNPKLQLNRKVTPSKKIVSIRSNIDDPLRLVKKTSHDLRLDRSSRALKNCNSVGKNQEKVKRMREKDPFIMREEDFIFEFILVKQSRLCSGKFKLKLSTGHTLKMMISLMDERNFPLVGLCFRNIHVVPETPTAISFQKFVWKVFKRIFVVNFMSEEDPFLMKEYNQDQQHLKNCNVDKAIGSEHRLLEVIHDYLIYWMKKQPFAYSFNGISIEGPGFNPEDINRYMDNLEFQHDRKMFQKRHGYLDSKSGRRVGLSPGMPSRILFSEIRNEFYQAKKPFQEDPINDENLKIQKNLMFLTKINASDRAEMKIIRLLFVQHVRQISIFEQGVFKHSGTTLIHEKIPIIRKLQNHPQLNRSRLISQVSNILTFTGQQYAHNDFQDILPNRSFHIEQQFEVDLTNEFKFIPSIQVRLVYDREMRDFEALMIQKQKVERQKKKGLVRRKIERDFLVGLESQEKKERGILKERNLIGKKTQKVLTTFKISLCLFLAAQFDFSWGRRLLCILKNLQFFDITPQFSLKLFNFSYRIAAISIYKIPLLLDTGTNQFESDDKKYLYYNVRKPFLSKLNTVVVLGKGQDNVKKLDDKNDSSGKLTERKGVSHQELHFIDEKLYIVLGKQKMLKFSVSDKPVYFLLQMYHTIEPSQRDLLTLTNYCRLFLYQLTNLKSPQIKYFISLEQQLSFQDSYELGALVDISRFTLKGEQMEKFQIPVQIIDFQNEFYEKKTKNVRKKVISEANYFFTERVLSICNNIKNQNILINVLHKYRVSKREKFKFS